MLGERCYFHWFVSSQKENISTETNILVLPLGNEKSPINRAFNGIYLFRIPRMVEATGIEPVSENPLEKLSTSVACLLRSLAYTSISRLTCLVSRDTLCAYGRGHTTFTTSRRPNRCRGPHRQDGPLLSSSQF